MHRHIPFDVAMSLTNAELLGFTVIMGELDGGTFDWDNMEWEKRGG